VVAAEALARRQQSEEGAAPGGVAAPGLAGGPGTGRAGAAGAVPHPYTVGAQTADAETADPEAL